MSGKNVAKVMGSVGQTSVILIGFMPNPRIYKRIELEKKTLNVHLICWDRGGSMLSYPHGEGYTAHVIKIKAGGDPVRRFLPYQKFVAESMKLLKEIQPDLIHVQGLDMLKIACSYKKRCTKPVSIIYEVADLHRLLVDKQKDPVRKLAQAYLRHEDKRLTNSYDLLVLTSEKYYELYFRNFVPQEKYLYMPNVPDLSAFRSYKKKPENEPFTVGYIGAVRYKKQMVNMVEAGRASGVRLLIAGYEDEPQTIETMCKDDPQIDWIGRFDFNARAAELYGRCDVMYSVYNADMQNVRVALPNKLYEAVYCEMPLIVAKNTYLAQLVEQWGVGIAVDHREPSELIAAIEKLRSDSALRQSIADNCAKIKPEVDLEVYNQRLQKKINNMLRRR